MILLLCLCPFWSLTVCIQTNVSFFILQKKKNITGLELFLQSGKFVHIAVYKTFPVIVSSPLKCLIWKSWGKDINLLFSEHKNWGIPLSLAFRILSSEALRSACQFGETLLTTEPQRGNAGCYWLDCGWASSCRRQSGRKGLVAWEEGRGVEIAENVSAG